jgi:exo-beta-1,3-glucanase (GH17 family)
MRTLTREFYIAKDGQKVTSNKLPEESAVCYISTAASGRVSVQFFIGKQSKPDKYLAYKSRESANTAIEAFFDNLVRVYAYKQEQKERQKLARQAAKAEFEGTIGSVFVASWGYDQTNVDAYQITARINNQTVEVVEIGFEHLPEESKGYSSMAENVKPLPVSAEKAAKMPKLLARITAKDSIQVANKRSAGNADLWDGARSYYHSWYA